MMYGDYRWIVGCGHARTRELDKRIWVGRTLGEQERDLDNLSCAKEDNERGLCGSSTMHGMGVCMHAGLAVKGLGSDV